jgi:RNA polymerase sigma-70 factor (ECF subfamily)
VRSALDDDQLDHEHDAVLARAAQHGDQEAFIRLYDRYYHRIVGYVRSRVTSGSEVEDLVSTAFMHALTNIHRYHPEKGQFSTWLFAIARNAVRNHHRRERRPLLPALPRNPIADPQHIALSREAARQMQEAIAQLSRDQQDALALRYGADLPFADVAAVIGKSEGAAKMLVQRALGSLRQRLTEEYRP